jgi:hypothetical protein
MAAHKSALRSDAHRTFELGPPMAERATLELEPSAAAVEFYLLTAAAERAWAAINDRREERGALFWIHGPAGAGKTHFLNYVLALEERAGANAGRRAIVRLPAADGARVGALEQRLLDGLAREIGAAGHETALWRRMRGAPALGLALGHARRVGIRSVSIALDLGTADPAEMRDYFDELVRSVGANRGLALKVFVATRAAPCEGVRGLEVAPANDKERVLAALARARRVIDHRAAVALYDDVDRGGFEPEAIFPFHPRALRVLHAIVDPPVTVAVLGDLIANVLNDRRERGTDTYEEPLLPVELLQIATIARRVDERLGEDGRSAVGIAHRATDKIRDRPGARAVIDALMLETLGSGAALSIRELGSLLPAECRANGADGSSLWQLLTAIAPRSAGVVIFDGRSARFDAHAVHAAQLAVFNAALPLIRRFDATIGAITEFSELDDRMTRLDAAMNSALEEAYRVASSIEAVERDAHGALASEHRRTLDDFIALADGGARALIELGADPERRADTTRIVAAYEDLAMAAAAAARMRVMREYLRATGLRPDFVRDGPPADSVVTALVVECQLLLAALDAGVLPDAQRRFDAIETRFEKFKWSYIAAYRAAHAIWQRASERMAAELADAREHFAALARLNAIAALGAPAGAELSVRIEEVSQGIRRCDDDAPIGPKSPRCAQCGFVLGAQLPERELAEVFDQVKRALGVKLAALSRGAISRLIRMHDRGRRLDGFLKIIQAAHTEALVRVLDNNLAAYLTRLLREADDEVAGNQQSDEVEASGTGGVVKQIERRRIGLDPLPRARRRAKPQNERR